MSRSEELAAAYSQVRPRLVRVAYAVLGTLAEAEDVVSDTWLRLVEADERQAVANVPAWATVAVARRAVDVLRSARVQRETYVGPWLPEPDVALLPGGHIGLDPADRATLEESVSFALLVVLEALTPAERTAWVLHDLFAMPFDQVASIVGRTPAAVRQLASRARRRVAAGSPRVAVDDAEHREVVGAFARAAEAGDLAGLLAVLDPDVVLTNDGGGEVTAARRPVLGADRVARFALGIAGKPRRGRRLEFVAVNGAVGLAVLGDDGLVLVGSLTVRDRLVERVDLVLAPDKLARADARLQARSAPPPSDPLRHEPARS